MKKFKVEKVINFMMVDCPYDKWDVVCFGGYHGIVIKIKKEINRASRMIIYTGKINSKFDFYFLGVKVFFWNLIGKI